jgi:hypothetical protein
MLHSTFCLHTTHFRIETENSPNLNADEHSIRRLPEAPGRVS